MDTDFWVLLALGCYLETFFTTQANGHRFLFGEADTDDEPIRINERYQRMLHKTWKVEQMVTLSVQVKGSLGKHSVRKFPSTWAAEHGASQEHIEICGRWKGGKNGQTVNRYINVEQLPTDGHVAAILCVGGPINGAGITLDWMHEHVVPGIHSHFQGDESNFVAGVLSHAVMFAAFHPGLEHMLPDSIRNRIRNGFDAI
jgi:hypothetical protein